MVDGEHYKLFSTRYPVTQNASSSLDVTVVGPQKSQVSDVSRDNESAALGSRKWFLVTCLRSFGDSGLAGTYMDRGFPTDQAARVPIMYRRM
jgi:hypothetical protein